MVGDGGRGTWCGNVKINPVCWTGVGNGRVGLRGMDTMWAKVVVSSSASSPSSAWDGW